MFPDELHSSLNWSLGGVRGLLGIQDTRRFKVWTYALGHEPTVGS